MLKYTGTGEWKEPTTGIKKERAEAIDRAIDRAIDGAIDRAIDRASEGGDG